MGRVVVKLYRYEDALTHSSLAVRLIEFESIRETDCGYWFVESWLVSDAFNQMAERSKRWVSKGSRKRYCYPTKDEAWNSYIIRKERQLAHLERQCKWAKQRADYLNNNPERPEGREVEMGHHGLVQFDDY